MSFQSGGDLCLGFFQAFWDAQLLPDLPPNAHVLEIGCAEADWLSAMRQARGDLHLTGIDWRSDARPSADLRIIGDVLQQSFEPASFDAIIAVSMLEWCGTSKYGDPIYPNGDRDLLVKARQWLKPDGWLYFDVPYAPAENPRKGRNGIMRVYDDADLARILGAEWQEVTRRYFSGDGHPDGPYVALLVRPA